MKRARAARGDREDHPQAARRHDAAGRLEAARCGHHRGADRGPRVADGRTRPRSIPIPAGVRSSVSTAPSTRRAVEGSARASSVDVSAFLPADTISNGFDNVADAQGFSPTLMEGYLRAAGRITTARARRSELDADGSHLQGAAHASRRWCMWTARRSAPAAVSRSCTCSRRTANTASASCCTRFPTGELYGSIAPSGETDRDFDQRRSAWRVMDINYRR